MTKQTTVLLALLAVSARGVHAQSGDIIGTTYAHNNLKGLSSVVVLVKAAALPDFGLDTKAIQNEIELRFRQAGLTISPSLAVIVPGGYPGLFLVRIEAFSFPPFPGTGTMYGFHSLSIRLVERALLERSGVPTIAGARMALVGTWMSDDDSLFGDSTASLVRRVIQDRVSEFLNQWLKDNGK